MNNNFQDYNEEEYNNEDKKENKKRIRNRVNLFIVLLIVCFFSTYFIVDRLTNSKYKDVSDNQSKTAVYNNTNLLSDDMKIILKVDGVVEKSETLKDFKLDNEIDSVNEQFLVDYYASKGYSVESLSEKKVVLNKDEEEVTVEPNKYYLGEKDGYCFSSRISSVYRNGYYGYCYG